MEGQSNPRPIKDSEALSQELIEARIKIRTLEQKVIEVTDIPRRLDVIESRLTTILQEKEEERRLRLDAECETMMLREETNGVIRALKDQLSMVRVVAEDTCIIEGELRAYLLQFVSGNIGSSVEYMQSEISRLTAEIGRQGPIPMRAEITTIEEYKRALKAANTLAGLDPKEGSIEAELLRELGLAIEYYETERFPIEPPTSEEASEFRAEQESSVSGNKDGEENEQSQK